MGGVNKWRSSMAEALSGRRVRILPDADAPGRALAARVYADLAGVASEVVIVNLPGLADDSGEDVYDWVVKHGNDVERLRALAGDDCGRCGREAADCLCGAGWVVDPPQGSADAYA